MIKYYLKTLGACKEAIQEHGNDSSLQEAWNRCNRPDWMIWLLRRIPEHKDNKILFIRIALEAAKSVVHLSKDPESRPQKAIEAVEQYILNPSEENRLKCRNANAYAAAYAAANAAADENRAKIAQKIREILFNLGVTT